MKIVGNDNEVQRDLCRTIEIEKTNILHIDNRSANSKCR
jgi:hypothetical protein